MLGQYCKASNCHLGTDLHDNLLRFICCIFPSSWGSKAVFTKGYPPEDVVEVPLHSTIGDLNIVLKDLFPLYLLKSSFYV